MVGAPVLEARNIVKTFPGVRAVDGVDLAVRSGEVHALVGENGAGKSTLMLTLGGIHRPDSGEIEIDGQAVTFANPHDANAKGISIVFQELSLVPSLSIAENIFANRQPVNRLGMLNRKLLYRNTREMLTLFDMSHLDPAMLVKDLSISNQQVVEILKAISMDPKVLILDEPTASLTEAEVDRLFSNISKLKDERGLSFIYISHHLSEIFRIADTVTVLRDGKKVCDAAVPDIDEDFLVTNMVGRAISNMYGSRSSNDEIGPVLFEAKDISGEGFDNVSFDVRRGEIVGFSGLIGAGRTEVGRAIFGSEPIHSGSMCLDGQPVRIRTPKHAIQEGIGYLSEDRKSQGLFLNFSIKANLISNHLQDFCGGMRFIRESKVNEFAKDCVNRYRIISRGVEQTTALLSGGNQQKVLVATWFGIRPKLLIVDEPTRGVDVGAKSEIYGLLRELARQGVAIVMISSDLMEILGVSDRIVVMKSGRVVGRLHGSEATEEGVIAMAAGSGERDVAV